jgi:hypothetical protein
VLLLYLLKVNSIQIHYQERHSLITLRQLLIRLGYNENKFCGHSFRIGAATSADAAGVEDHVIQTQFPSNYKGQIERIHKMNE